ncbi:MAG: hypothetical protein LUD81_11195 [Clostridiales bacterium]|nr:hypothetical protein [Clostridiales bacterium]
MDKKIETFDFEIKKAALSSALQAEMDKKAEDLRIANEKKEEANRKEKLEADKKLAETEQKVAKKWGLDSQETTAPQQEQPEQPEQSVKEEEKEQTVPISSVQVSAVEVTNQIDFMYANMQLKSVYEQNKEVLQADKSKYKGEKMDAETALREKITEFMNYDFSQKLDNDAVDHEARTKFIDRTLKENADLNLNNIKPGLGLFGLIRQKGDYKFIADFEQLSKDCNADVETLRKQTKAANAMAKTEVEKIANSFTLKRAEKAAARLDLIATEGRWLKDNAHTEKSKMYAFFKQVQVNARTAMDNAEAKNEDGIEAARKTIVSAFRDEKALARTEKAVKIKEAKANSKDSKEAEKNTAVAAFMHDAIRNGLIDDGFRKDIMDLNHKVNEMRRQVKLTNQQLKANREDLAEKKDQLKETKRVLKEKEQEKEKDKVKMVSLSDFKGGHVAGIDQKEQIKNKQPVAEKQAEQEKTAKEEPKKKSGFVEVPKKPLEKGAVRHT